MSSGDAKFAPGGHYSGRNPVPNIQKFIENMDRDKKARDEQMMAQQAAISGQVEAHKDKRSAEPTSSRQTVTDPTTGKQVQIEDVDDNFMEAALNPKLSVPNANLGKPTTMKSDKNQSGDEYKQAQDVTAPPDPIHPGSTSDVPIHGEKTNVLFHPTPSVSYEPMFEALEKRTEILCIGVLVVIVILGKMFGGALYGLIPLGMCVSSGIFLWMKAVLRAGRNQEWSSEQERGETVRQPFALLIGCANYNPLGCRKSNPRISRVDEYFTRSCLGPD